MLPRREKLFGYGRVQPLSRSAKVTLMREAWALTRPTAPGKHYGALTAKAVAVLGALLWQFHNARDGRCFPSYDAIAAASGCARSTVHLALKALEAAGLLSWCHRLRRTAVRIGDRVGWVCRVLRTSNAYVFPSAAAKSEHPPRTPNQCSSLPCATPVPAPAPHYVTGLGPDPAVPASLGRLGSAVMSSANASRSVL